MDDRPSITIITPSLNRVGMIDLALDSVRAQAYPNIRHVVVDGLSTDGTLEKLRARSDLTLIAARDENLYEAINRGLETELGDIVCFLNTDDRFADHAFDVVAELFRDNPGADVVSGAIAIERDGAAGEPATIIDDRRFLALDVGNLINGPTLTNSRFFRRDLLRRIGMFDTRFPVVSDRDFLIRAWHEARAEVVTKQVLYIYRSHGTSLTMAMTARSRSIATEMRRAAVTRTGETRSAPIGHAYARWAAWAGFYEAVLDLWSQPGPGALWRLLRAPFSSPGGFTRQLLRTIVDRRARRGRAGYVSPLRTPDRTS